MKLMGQDHTDGAPTTEILKLYLSIAHQVYIMFMQTDILGE